MSMGAIRFGPNQPWGAISQTEYQRKAKDHRHPLAYRLHFAALGWANRIGHAEFAEGALANILMDEDGKPPPKSGVANAIKRAKALDLLAPDSRARCLVLGGWHFQKAGQGSASCKTHALRCAGAAA